MVLVFSLCLRCLLYCNVRSRAPCFLLCGAFRVFTRSFSLLSGGNWMIFSWSAHLSLPFLTLVDFLLQQLAQQYSQTFCPASFSPDRDKGKLNCAHPFYYFEKVFWMRREHERGSDSEIISVFFKSNGFPRSQFFLFLF